MILTQSNDSLSNAFAHVLLYVPGRLKKERERSQRRGSQAPHCQVRVGTTPMVRVMQYLPQWRGRYHFRKSKCAVSVSASGSGLPNWDIAACREQFVAMVSLPNIWRVNPDHCLTWPIHIIHSLLFQTFANQQFKFGHRESVCGCQRKGMSWFPVGLLVTKTHCSFPTTMDSIG